MAPPARELLTETEPPVLELQLPELLLPIPAIAGFEEHHVNGTPVIVLPRVSSTVGVTLVLVPFETTTELLGLPWTIKVIDCTAQLVKGKGRLFTLLAVAKIEVRPGV